MEEKQAPTKEELKQKDHPKKKKRRKPPRYFDDQHDAVEVFTPDLGSLSKNKIYQNIAQWKKEQETGKQKHVKNKKTNKDQKEYVVDQKIRRRKKGRNLQDVPAGPMRQSDPFPGEAPISKSRLKKYERGKKSEVTYARTKFAKEKFLEKEKKLAAAVKQAARTELLLHEESGFLEAEEGEHTTDLTQYDIADAVDITSAQKYFELTLDQFGPYRMNYTRNGRFLLLGGSKGHVAAIDWHTKKLMCEMNVMETVNDVRWLHQETMFAVAQKQWTYVYDNQGIELHCLKALDSVLRLDFLPYHFLLVSANAKGYLAYLDVSVGQKIAGHHTGLGRLDVLCQNPHNAITCLGHPGGTVTMWSPNVKEPLIKMLCHGGSVRSVAVEHKGRYMATSGVDRTMKIWDLRMYRMLQSYRIGAGAGALAFSQKDMLAAAKGNLVEVYQDCCRQTVTSPYMCHKLRSSVHGLQFCPYEDVLGVSHGNGFASLLIPGSGEANFDALEANPFQTKKQRRHAEVKLLLDKIQPEMIHLDTKKIAQVDNKTLQDRMEDKKKLLFLKPKPLEFEPKYKMKGKSRGHKREQRKKGVLEEHKRETVRELVAHKQKQLREVSKNVSRNKGTASVLDRFKTKDA